MTAVTSSFPGFSLRKKRGRNDFPLLLQDTDTTPAFRICPKIVGRCLRRRPVMRTAFTRSGLRCYGGLPCFFTVSQLSVAPNGSDGLVLSKCLTAAPLPCAACGLISLDERRRPERPEKHGKCRRQTGSGRKLAKQLTWNVVVKFHSFFKDDKYMCF